MSIQIVFYPFLEERVVKNARGEWLYRWQFELDENNVRHGRATLWEFDPGREIGTVFFENGVVAGRVYYGSRTPIIDSETRQLLSILTLPTFE